MDVGDLANHEGLGRAREWTHPIGKECASENGSCATSSGTSCESNAMLRSAWFVAGGVPRPIKTALEGALLVPAATGRLVGDSQEIA